MPDAIGIDVWGPMAVTEAPGDCNPSRPFFVLQTRSVLYIPRPDGSYMEGMDGMEYAPDAPAVRSAPPPTAEDAGDCDELGCGAPGCDDGYTDDGTCEACHGLGEDYRRRYSLLGSPDDCDDCDGQAPR